MSDSDQIESGFSEDFPAPVEMSGVVKWFDSVRGYGMIESGGGGSDGDIFLHISCLRRSGLETLGEGSRIVFEAVRGKKGLQAVNILSVKSSRAASALSEKALFAAVPASRGMKEVNVCWFNRKRGYGFLRQGSEGPDIFVSLRVLREAGFVALYPGQKVLASVSEGGRGLLATRVSPCFSDYRRGQMFAVREKS